MRRIQLAIALTASLAAAVPAAAQSHRMGNDTAWVTDRRAVGHSTFHIVSRDGTSALLLTDTTIVAQLTDAGLEHLKTSTDSTAKDDGVTARFFASMARGLLGHLFDHAIEYDLHDLASAEYTNGRLMLTSRDGHQPFGDVNMFGHQLMEDFSPADAKAFAARANQARARLR